MPWYKSPLYEETPIDIASAKARVLGIHSERYVSIQVQCAAIVKCGFLGSKCVAKSVKQELRDRIECKYHTEQTLL